MANTSSNPLDKWLKAIVGKPIPPYTGRQYRLWQDRNLTYKRELKTPREFNGALLLALAVSAVLWVVIGALIWIITR